jgi:hypothetical protein
MHIVSFLCENELVCIFLMVPIYRLEQDDEEDEEPEAEESDKSKSEINDDEEDEEEVRCLLGSGM